MRGHSRSRPWSGYRRGRRSRRSNQRRQLQLLPRPDRVGRGDRVPLCKVAKIHTLAESDRIQRVALLHLVTATGYRRACRGHRTAAGIFHIACTGRRFDHHGTAHGAAGGKQQCRDDRHHQSKVSVHGRQHNEAGHLFHAGSFSVATTTTPAAEPAAPAPSSQSIRCICAGSVRRARRTVGSTAPAATLACRGQARCRQGTAAPARR